MAFSRPSPRCAFFDAKPRKLNKELSPRRPRRQDRWLTFTLAPVPGGVEQAGVQVFFRCNARARRKARSGFPEILVSPAEDGPVRGRLTAIHASAAARDFLAQHRRLI